MLHCHAATGLGALVGPLVAALGDPTDDPFAPELVVVPTEGVARWLRLELAAQLGATPGRSDGVVANLTHAFPGLLRQRVLEAGLAGEPDPWALDRLSWVVLEVLVEHAGDDRLGPLADLGAGARRWSRARRAADLVDRYGVHRPEMVTAWARGHDVDGTGSPLESTQRWQPALFRLVRERLGRPSPAERLPGLLDALGAGRLTVDLPARLSVFGLSSVPGGGPFCELLRALGQHRAVGLYLVQPCPSLGDGTEPTHPLLRSWGRTARDAARLVATELGPPTLADAPGSPAAPTALTALRAEVHADRSPSGPGADGSIQVHRCAGPLRQVEALRDALLTLLAEDASLREDDVVVVCPQLATFAPLVETVFGAAGIEHRITDRTLRESYAMTGAVGDLVRLCGSRFGASEVLDWISLQPVRDALGFGDEELATVARWVSDAGVRWGLDATHRTHWDVPPYAPGTWRWALDRLLLGVATTDDPDALAIGELAPVEVDDRDIVALGRLARHLDRLGALASTARTPRAVASWAALLASAAEELLVAPRHEPWQRDALAGLLDDLAATSTLDGEPSTVPISLADLGDVLEEVLAARPGRPDFFRGGVTVSSLTPLRNVSFRVVAVLGLDEGVLSTAGADGDDLVAATPRPGDPDPRAEARMGLLEAVLAATDHLIITCTGRDLITNLEVPSCTALAELLDVTGPVTDVAHPRQAFDPANFTVGGLVAGRRWSHDTIALAGARARVAVQAGASLGPVAVDPVAHDPVAHDPGPAEVIELDDLRRVLTNPPREYLARTLGVRLPRASGGGSGTDDLAVALAGLDRWEVAERLIAERRRGVQRQWWERREHAAGTLPPGAIGHGVASALHDEVDGLIDAARELGAGTGRRAEIELDVDLGEGARLRGWVEAWPGPVTVTYSRLSPKLRLAAWLDLLALTLTDPEPSWRAVVVGRKATTNSPEAVALQIAGEDPTARAGVARAALAVAVDCYRRALAEPVPLFEQISWLLHRGKATAADWTSSFSPRDGDQPAVALLFGDLGFDELCRLEVRDHDPAGEATDRAHRFAAYLWGAFDRSVVSP